MCSNALYAKHLPTCSVQHQPKFRERSTGNINGEQTFELIKKDNSSTSTESPITYGVTAAIGCHITIHIYRLALWINGVYTAIMYAGIMQCLAIFQRWDR